MEENYYVVNKLFATTKAEAVTMLKKAVEDGVKTYEAKLGQASGTGIELWDLSAQIMCATETVYLNTETALLDPESADNIVNILNAVNDAHGSVLDVSKCMYLTNADTDVIKIVLAYK
jgi:hypothetical protein